MRELHDGAAIYTVGHIPNSQIYGNYINRTGGQSGGNAIYTDQSSAYFEIKNNVLNNYLNGVYWFVWGTYAYVHDINIHDNYAYSINGSEGQYATNSYKANNTSAWTTTTTVNAANAGLELSYKDILPSDLYPSVGLGEIEAENCIPLGRGATYDDSFASGGKGVQTIDLLGDGLRIGKTTSDINMITVRYASMQSGTYSLYVNGIHASDINFTSNGVWNGAYTNASVLLDFIIAAGSVVELRRDINDAGWNIDKIKLENIPSTKLEAENATKLGRAANYADAVASGGYGAQYLDLAGDGLQFTNVPESNKLTVYYASQNTGTYSVYVDGTHTADLNFTSNGRWYGGYTSASVNINIPSGATLKLQRDSGDVGLNMDYITL